EPMTELTSPSTGLAMNWLAAMRSKSERMALVSWLIEARPDSAARAMVEATALKLRLTALSMLAAEAAKSPRPCAAPPGVSGSAMLFVRMKGEKFVETATVQRRRLREMRLAQRAPFRQRQGPEIARRQAHHAEAEADDAPPGKGPPCPCPPPPGPAG